MLKQRAIFVVALAVVVLGTAAPVGAQPRPAPMVEVVSGWAGFIDENWVDRAMIGAGGRIFLTERIAVGPEFVFLHGFDDDYDWTLTGTATIDLVRDVGPTGRRVVPYVVAGGGYLRQVARIGTTRFASGEGTASGGVGVRVRLGARAFIAPEIRVGYEPELRIGATIGVRPRR